VRRRNPERLLAVLLCAALANGTVAVERPKSDVIGEASAIRVLLSADVETTLSSQMNGTLGSIRVALGDRVRKDALLVQVDCREAQARASVAAAELAMAKQNLAAREGMRGLQAVGDLEVATARTELEKASGAQTLAVTQSGYCRVRAPFAARIAKVYVRPFQTVAAGAPLFDLLSDGPLKIRLNAPSSMMRDIARGTRLSVRVLETGHSYPAHVSAINARVDAVAQTIELEARFDGDTPDLVAGMTGVATLAGSDAR
jgi:RND family efflux transporter MFP subunit